jgi:hypothetical protein
LPGFSCRQRSTRPFQLRNAETRIREPAHAALARGKLLDLDELQLWDRQNDELRNSHPGLDQKRLFHIGVEQHDSKLAAVAGIDEPRRVHHRETVAGCEPGAGLDEAGVAVRDRDGKPRADEGSLAWRELDALAGREVQAGIPRVGALGNDRVIPQPLDRQLDQRARRTGSTRASATR